MSLVVEEQLLPEEKLPSLVPVYQELERRRKYYPMDMLDCMVFAHPRPVTRDDVFRHIYGDLGTQDSEQWRGWVRTLNTHLDACNMQIRKRRAPGQARLNHYTLERVGK